MMDIFEQLKGASCQDCLFVQQEEGSGDTRYLCRRYAPKPEVLFYHVPSGTLASMSEDGGSEFSVMAGRVAGMLEANNASGYPFSAWPEVFPTSWCGEFIRKGT